MSHSEPNTETAFPAMTPGGYCTPGMTLRDYFAGQALAGLLVNGSYYSKDAAEESYSYADAMLAAREPKDTTTAQQIALGIGGVE